jgi:predicted acyltransferase
MYDSSCGHAAAPPTLRVSSMDQFRGLTVLLMFAVHYYGPSWGLNLEPVLRHNHYYLSVGDLAFPWFHLAVGFALRLTLLRRLQTHGAWAAYGRVVRRCLLLILLGDAPALVGGLHMLLLGAWQHSDFLPWLATFIKHSGWSILAVIGVTSLWVLPVMGKSARARLVFLLGGLTVHALAMQTFYMGFMNGWPNPVDTVLGTTGVLAVEGGPLGFLVWAVPQIIGSLVHDLVVGLRPQRSCEALLGWGLMLVAIGYGFSCLSTLYPVVQGPQWDAWSYPDTEQRVQSSVLPPLENRWAGDLRLSDRSTLRAPAAGAATALQLLDDVAAPGHADVPTDGHGLRPPCLRCVRVPL